MQTVGAQRQVLDPRHRTHRQRSVKMGEQLAAPGRFPAQGIAQFRRFDRQQRQSGLTGAVAGRAFHHLGGGGKMDKAVQPILG